MAWTFPFSASVQLMVQTPDGTTKIAGNPANSGSAQTVACDLQPKTPGQAYQDWGVEMNNPAYLYYAVADVAKVAEHARVTIETVVYAVKGKPVTRNAPGNTQYCMALLERLEA